MRISDVISLAGSYLTLGFVIAAAVGILFCAGYFLIYRKVMKGKKKIPGRKLLWAAVLICYLAVVAGATMLSRGSWYEGSAFQPLFYSYRMAWYSFSVVEWRNLVLNILMFVPLGFLLPLGSRFFQKWYRTYLAGFLMTVGIEGVQFLLRRGICEADDILNNTLGTMIGYGGYALVCLAVDAARRKGGIAERNAGTDGPGKDVSKKAVPRKNARGGEKLRVGRVLVLQIPLAVVTAAFTLTFVIYAGQELGNLTSTCIAPVKKELLEVSTEETYSGDEAEAEVYQAQVLSREETREVAETFFSHLGTEVDDSQTDVYNETIIYHSGADQTLWVNYLGGTTEFTDFDLTFGENREGGAKTVEGAGEQEIRRALEAYGIALPENAVFADAGEGIYEFSSGVEPGEETSYLGTLRCTYCEGGNFSDISNGLVKLQRYKTFALISEQEAFEKIQAGEFQVYQLWQERRALKVGNVTLDYQADSKGFYQPVYVFEITGESPTADAFAAQTGEDSWQIAIPALKK